MSSSTNAGMNQAAEAQQAGMHADGRCICHQFIDLVRERLGVSPAVKQHLMASRVEFLKAIRVVIDERIEHLSAKGQQGTKIAVE
ncbi:MAG TPA: hypothetical protein VG322_11365 [Candidatus Acidoferrales bacterium]|nr:hypothetical protein [Candidatus Acidoferrales bacterium]